ncbi:glycosyltransferase family 39 protein [Gemmobacter serpentinus]|uniref:glycosyltransferase family 39 protein n=1 Tax=Gemmobacter serpentinus TaxID=2652247 RepID=UPI00124CB958|nr:glycosyltransferase family 39 protein [Gemmobacter serpentinus]
MTLSTKTSLLLILALALALRLIWGLLVAVDPVSDQGAYDTFARTLLTAGVHGWSASEPSAYWAAGTAFLYAGAYWIFGAGGTAVLATNLVLTAIIIPAGFRLAANWFGARAGLTAALLLALWPTLIFFTTTINSELPFIALCFAGLCLWDGQARHRMAWPLTGLIWGAALMVRPVILLLPIGLAFARVMRQGLRGWPGVPQTLVLMFLMLAVTEPWANRNEVVMGSDARISTNFGPNLWMGNNPDSTGGYMELPADVHDMTEAERDRTLKDRAYAYMRSDPLVTAKRTAAKFLQLHERETIGIAWNENSIRSTFGAAAITPLKLLATGYWFLLMGGALAGFVMLCFRDGPWRALWHPSLACWGYFSLLHAVVVVEDRYHLPGGVFFALLAACFFEALFRRAPLTRAIPEDRRNGADMP